MDKLVDGNLAAVMVLYEVDSSSLILTQRNAQLKNHPGEICFPGGRWQASDVDLYTTALRELQEELGIDASRIYFEKALEEVRTLTGFIIKPWFGRIKALDPYQLDCQEVDSVFRIPIKEARVPENYQQIMVERNGIKFQSYQYMDETRFIWGATARIMMQLIEPASAE